MNTSRLAFRVAEQQIQRTVSIADLLLVGFFSGLHVLIEDVPGVGKTTLAKSLAASVNNGPAGVGITLRV